MRGLGADQCTYVGVSIFVGLAPPQEYAIS